MDQCFFHPILGRLQSIKIKHDPNYTSTNLDDAIGVDIRIAFENGQSQDTLRIANFGIGNSRARREDNAHYILVSSQPLASPRKFGSEIRVCRVGSVACSSCVVLCCARLGRSIVIHKLYTKALYCAVLLCLCMQYYSQQAKRPEVFYFGVDQPGLVGVLYCVWSCVTLRQRELELESNQLNPANRGTTPATILKAVHL